MANNSVGKLRRSAVLMTYAPGAIMDMRSGKGPVSGVSAGLEEWDRSAPLAGNLKYQKIVERRLCKKLGKKYFRLPPVLEDDAKRLDGSPDESSLVVRRFPSWLQCPECELMRPASKWSQDPGKAYRYCASCSTRHPGNEKVFVIPVRFASACTMGHLDEFPWNFWLSHQRDCATRGRDMLKLSSAGPGLGGLILQCPSCQAKRSMDGAFGEKALSGLNCRGARPWLRVDDSSCSCSGDEGTYRAVQRGASNLYYPVIESALDIPPWTRRLQRTIGDYWDILMDIEDHGGRVSYIRSSQHLGRILQRERMTAEALAAAFEQMVGEVEETNVGDLRVDEYRVFSGPMEECDEEFEIHREGVPDELLPYISKVMRVARLREVRVVKGFTRILPPSDPDGVQVAPISNGPLEWLPAIEVRGEGIFLQLNIDALRAWEALPEVISRVASATESWRTSWHMRNGKDPIPFEATPRLLMLHSFSHALIRQLTLECGYSTASLRERLYVSEGLDGMAGVLIYTATSDSDGTLGGLQRRASEDLLGPTVIGALRSAQWCSSDPLCISGETGAPDSHSVAACHSCMLVPETSCEHHNRFLDRALLTGVDDGAGIGFFESLLA
ncbi:hypothetical protein LMG18090_03630 [Ralstonia mannitolilytica]|uniref:DUF1998 domain-containing protein n=1 Tax=Ralstonia mannitolilytica TaxID=105219 RepID=UPI0028F5726B|nr:DUF1998 domain-containing protein [Ralstonia mannitolilytica]CAJ0797894.1 hypothetical protein LMG18090_03630 [Ralstonia mannitolilytica]